MGADRDVFVGAGPQERGQGIRGLEGTGTESSCTPGQVLPTAPRMQVSGVLGGL